ncbi:malonyl-CoA-acyl carrier protein transacylase, mitochondrial-like isoform X2 [Panonychus citri]|uniref:malonyl-CoA-acyl carrier protein transacylase, mitochondrial-like isoform X2 n=1 Tax=Panonychus citri TaxID=50023 RepID=UPI002307C0A1|nr:malonyl-CoA-acyl carrier protein transacylase, mitochondrial-like isoform X2 [Panonychus citri]
MSFNLYRILELYKPINSQFYSQHSCLRFKVLPFVVNKFHRCLSTESNVNNDNNEKEIVTTLKDEEGNKSLLPRRKPPKFLLDNKSVDPSRTSIILFPGQGSQFVGMGHNLLEVPNVEEMFQTANRILGYDLLEMCLNGPAEELDETVHCQPAIFVTSLGAVEKLRITHPGVVEACIGTAGFSVGELASLVFAGAFSFEDGLRLVKIRAEAMQEAAERVPGGLITIKFGPDARISFACRAAVEWCLARGIDEDHAVCSVSNHLFPHCKVIGGHEEALRFIELNASEFGIKLTKRLKVSGAFHTKLMRPAKKKFKEALMKTPSNRLRIPCYSNLDAKVYRFEKQIHEKLSDQIFKSVRWEQVMSEIYRRPEGFEYPKTFECGPGSTLRAILRNCNNKAFKVANSISV